MSDEVPNIPMTDVPVTEVPVPEEEAWFSTLDLLILSMLAGFAVYWLFFKNKKQEQPVFKKLVVQPMAGKIDDPSFINKMKNSKRNVIVFYGSQTGTAEEFAGRLAKDSIMYGMKGMVADPEECELYELSRLSEIDNALALFCMATYGEGDPTDNAQDFYEWLQSGDTDLSGVKFAVFALGNKTYEHYNAMGKYVDKRLEELGGTRVFELGMGDDDANIEEDFVNWREKFWPAVCEHFGVEATGDQGSVRQYSVTINDDIPKEKIYTGEIARLGSFTNQKLPFFSIVNFLGPTRNYMNSIFNAVEINYGKKNFKKTLYNIINRKYTNMRSKLELFTCTNLMHPGKIPELYFTNSSCHKGLRLVSRICKWNVIMGIFVPFPNNYDPRAFYIIFLYILYTEIHLTKNNPGVAGIQKPTEKPPCIMYMHAHGWKFKHYLITCFNIDILKIVSVAFNWKLKIENFTYTLNSNRVMLENVTGSIEQNNLMIYIYNTIFKCFYCNKIPTFVIQPDVTVFMYFLCIFAALIHKRGGFKGEGASASYSLLTCRNPYKYACENEFLLTRIVHCMRSLSAKFIFIIYYINNSCLFVQNLHYMNENINKKKRLLVISHNHLNMGLCVKKGGGPPPQEKYNIEFKQSFFQVIEKYLSCYSKRCNGVLSIHWRIQGEWLPGFGPPLFLTINAFEWEHIVGTPLYSGYILKLDKSQIFIHTTSLSIVTIFHAHNSVV
ncbi:NADPH-ferrihemoprotein reductase, partial [Mytilus galloprovincialis]